MNSMVATGNGPAAWLRAPNPLSGRLQGRLPTPLRVQKLRPEKGAERCAMRDVLACRGGFIRSHNMILLLSYSESVLGSFYIHDNVSQTFQFFPHTHITHTLVYLILCFAVLQGNFIAW